MAGDDSNPYAALLNGLGQSEAIAQEENPYPEIASGIAHLQLGPSMTMHGQPVAEVANPGKYLLQKALMGAGVGLTQGAGIGLQQQNNTDLTNALLTGDHSNISPEMWAPMNNAMGLFGAAQNAQMGMKLFENALDTKKALTEQFGGAVAHGEADPTTALNNMNQFLNPGTGPSPSAGSVFKLPPKEATSKGLELQDKLSNGDAASNYSDVKSAYNDLVDSFPDQTPTASVTMAQKLAQMVSPRARFNAATGEVATGDQGIDQLIKNHMSEIVGKGLDLGTRAQFLRAGTHLLQNQYGQYVDQTRDDVTGSLAAGVSPEFTKTLSGPDLPSAANKALKAGLQYKIPVADLSISLLKAFPDMKLQKNPSTGDFRMVPND